MAMKRPLEQDEADRTREKLQRRQEPVSCQFCRSKKLKCDRGMPCSNCRSRNLICSSQSVIRQNSVTEKSSEMEQTTTSQQNIHDLNERVRKLEHLLAQKESSTTELQVPNSATEHLFKIELPVETEYSNIISWMDKDSFQQMPPEETPAVRACARIANSFGAFIFAMTKSRTAPALSQHFFKMLPDRSRARALLDYYVSNINWIHHILHVPTIQKQFEEIYTTLESGQKPKYDCLALMSTIYSLSAYFSASSVVLFDSSDDAITHCCQWAALAQDALSAANGLANPTIETLQSLVLLTQHLLANIGCASTVRALAATIIYTAQAMGIHETDSPVNKKRREKGKTDWIEIELKRRLWWNITATDWIMSFSSGSQCGSYMVNVKQMNCDQPSNVDDDAINEFATYAQPPEVLTEMTYFNLRVRSAFIFRSIVDAAWEVGGDVDNLPYDFVLACDKQLNNLLGDLETSFQAAKDKTLNEISLDSAMVQESSLLARQRDMGFFGMHTRIASLHRAHLIRGAQEPRYAYSRMACLRSARTVIEIGKRMLQSKEPTSGVTAVKSWTLNHHLFVCTMILVMDYCFNKEEPRRKERREEILDCFRCVGHNKEVNSVSARGVKRLKEMLQAGSDNESAIRQHNPLMESTPALQHSSNTTPQTPAIAELLPPIQIGIIGNQGNANGLNGFDDAPPRQDWTEWENLFDGFNFDVDLDVSQFEELFQLEGQEYLQ